MAITVQWLNHASFKITGSRTLYIDPWKIAETTYDGDIVLVSHSHYDHFSAGDIAKVAKVDADVIAPADVIKKYGKGQVIEPGHTMTLHGVKVTGVAAYNPAKQFHPQGNKWVGFVIELDGRRIYYSGDTDFTPEMKAVSNLDLALLPIGGTYTLNPEEAAAAVNHIKPRRAIPYHFGDIVGSVADAQTFELESDCPVTILKPGDSTTL